MKRIVLLCLLLCGVRAYSQLLNWSPAFIQETSATVEINADASRGNRGLLNYTPPTDVYVHIGVITNLSTSSADWRYSRFTWGTTLGAANATFQGNNIWRYTITGGLRTFFNITNPSERILRIAILFRSGNGSRVLRNADGSDMYIPVYDNGFYARINTPARQPMFAPQLETVSRNLGDPLSIQASASASSNLRLLYNGTQIATTNNTNTISANTNISSFGDQTIVVEANNGSTIATDTIKFLVPPTVNVAPVPAGLKDGVNYEPGDTSVTLVVYAPRKTRIAVLGDFNNWRETVQHQMNRTADSSRFWLRITGLTPGVEYAYQYLIDGTLRLADYNTEKILDPNSDQFIPTATYPNLKPYPAGQTTGIVSVFQTAKPAYNWQITNFNRPDKRNLVIYELLVRDFIAARNYRTLRDSIPYFKRLGVNAIQLMPINEFENNESWGYNGSFFFAPDKYYGTDNDLKAFIDACHQNGIAVILDIALNHHFGQSPMVQMYWDGVNNRPAADNPWFNPVAKHAFNVGFDMNHESAATKEFTERVIDFWLKEYKIDGFRWDLSKGFTQRQTCDNSGGNCDVGTWGNYDASRVAIWQNYYNRMQQASNGSYCILEHFAANNEEIDLSNRGMLLWGNANYNFREATMGWVANSNLSSMLHNARGWSNPHLIGYMESHDEERMMYSNINFANLSNVNYNTRSLPIALQRSAMATAFWAVAPGPKMLWQFGEMGYDYSINWCTNNTVNTSCRTGNKPPRWDYLTNPDRLALFNTYSSLLRLRQIPAYRNTFTSGTIASSLLDPAKWMSVSGDSLKVVVIGNFDVNPQSVFVNFPEPGIYYSPLNNSDSIIVTNTGVNFNLAPGKFFVYTKARENTNTVLTLPTAGANVNNPFFQPVKAAVAVYPNPGKASNTTVVYDVPKANNIIIDVYNTNGVLMGNLYKGYSAKGRYTKTLGEKFAHLPQGIYIVRMICDGVAVTKTIHITP